ncbi:hypothetical protein NEF87_000686 [Candidatus Lokiarchaeum ossiferum]|uniref:Ig-like domain-containing protein n=1 Tax=Candidatus Lokiarchaeum ossiferum TaxID=2951803 RepID=A0ABY6HPE0_9ARCH|nr:hypothetical protein NEF87_000686 [Candidatus Lokiarchaeum sp. B-35]
MKRKTYAMLFLLLLAFPGITQFAGVSSMEAVEISPESAADPVIIVSEGDILYYSWTGEKINETDSELERGICYVEITEVNIAENYTTYDNYNGVFNETEQSWEWIYANDEYVGNDNERWLSDNFTYPIFNHSILFSTDIVDVNAVNLSENTDQRIMDAFSATSINSYYETSGGWHIVKFDLNRSDDPSDLFEVEAWVNASTGILTYYEETSNNYTSKNELIGFEIAALDFEYPDSFGLELGDTIDRFMPDIMDQGPDGPDGPDYQYMYDSDDLLEENDDYTSAYQLWEVETYNATRYGSMRSIDPDYYRIDITTDVTLHVHMHGHNQQVGFGLVRINPADGTQMESDWASDPDDYDMQIDIADFDGTVEFAVFSDYEHKAGYILEVELEHDIYGHPDIMDDFLEYRDGVQENDIFTNAVWLDQYQNPTYEDLTHWDDDYYNFSLGEFEELYIEVNNWGMGTEDLIIEELDNSGTLIQSSSSSDDDFGLVIKGGETRRDVILNISGENIGQGYQLQFDHLNPPFQQWIKEADYLEPNNDYENPIDISAGEYSVPAQFWDLSTFDDPDYYSFYVESGKHVDIHVQFYPGADVALSLIDPNTGAVLEGPYGGDGGTDKNGHIGLSFDTTVSGHHMIRVAGNTGYYGDTYSLEVRIDYEINEWYGNEKNDGDDKDENSLWMKDTVDFIYHNPATNEDIIIVSQEFFTSPGMEPEELVMIRPYHEGGRVNLNNISGSVGENYFHKDIDLTSAAFNDLMMELIVDDWGLVSTTNVSTAEWYELWGTTPEGDQGYFFIQLLPDIGTTRYFHMNRKENSTGREDNNWNFVIDCSAGGMNDTDPTLGVVEGDWWQYLVQEQYQNRKWGDGPEQYEENERVHLATFEVTHIFALNRTTMGVVGKMEVQTFKNDGSLNTEKHIERFEPLLVYDTMHPENFVTMGGHGGLEGPPVLLPMVANWSQLEGDMIDLFTSMEDGPGMPEAYNFDENAVRFRFEWGSDEPDYKNEGRQNIVLDVNEFGMTTHLDQDRYQRREENMGTYWRGEEQRERMVAFMTNGSKGDIYETNIPAVTGVSPLHEFVWERSEYRPAEGDQEAKDPSDKSYQKWRIINVMSACDKFIVFLGQQYWKGPDDTEYQSQEWHIETPEGPVDLNYWYLGSVRNDDVWTWFQSQIYDIGISDLSLYEDEIVEMLNYGLELGGAMLTPANVDIVGRSFTVRVQADGKEHVMRIAINDQGIMQDMFMGTKYISNGTWAEWDRTVLSEATIGYTTGEFFSDDIPANYVQLDLTDPTIILVSPSTAGDVEVGSSISITAADNVGVVELKYHWDSEAMVIVTGTLFTTPVPSALGIHELHIWAKDEAGNEKYVMFAFTTVEAGSSSNTTTNSTTETSTTGTDEPLPFDIPGYGYTSFAVFSLIGLVMIGLKRKKRT